MNKVTHIPLVSKFFLHLLTFAFFWLVIGDLIAIHEKLIYGFDPYGHNQPYTNSGNLNGSFVKKNQKVFKIRDGLHFYLFYKIEKKPQKRPAFVSISKKVAIFVFKYSIDYLFLGLRSPPQS